MLSADIRLKNVAPEGGLCVVEGWPLDSQLANGTSHRPRFQITTTPIRHDRRSIGCRVVPFSMRASACARSLRTSQCSQLPSHLAVCHGLPTRVSDQTISLDPGNEMLAGNGRPCSAYNSTTASNASWTLAFASSNVSPSVSNSGNAGEVTV